MMCLLFFQPFEPNEAKKVRHHINLDQFFFLSDEPKKSSQKKGVHRLFLVPSTIMFLPHGWVCIAFELGIQVKLLNIHVYYGKKGFGL